MTTLVFDSECNGFKPNIIWMVGIIDVDTDQYTSYVGDDVPAGLMRLMEADCVIGHYIKGYDIPVIEKLTDGLIQIDPSKAIDTVELSRMLFPQMKCHKLEAWGEIFGYPKIKFNKFDVFSPEMVPYCERDVRLNKVLYEFLLTQLDNPS